MAHKTITRAQEGEVIINNIPYKITGDVGFELTNIYGRKIQQGDPGPDDHPVNSTIAVSENTGGIGTFRHRGDEDRGNCWFSDLFLETRDNFSLHPESDLYTVAGQESSYAYTHDKLNGFQWATFGTALRRWDETNLEWDDPGSSTAPATPSGPGVTWGDSDTAKALYVPMGSAANYGKWDGAAWTSGTEVAIAFAVWSQKLFKLDGNGEVSFTADGGTTWTVKGYIPQDETPRGMQVGYDRTGERALLVRSSARTYFLDFINAELVESEFFYPDHPTGGLAGTYWRGASFVSAGVGIHRWAGDLVSPFGPDNKDGLPEEFAQGAITAMFGTYNELLVAIRSGDTEFVPEPETTELSIALPDTLYAQVGPVRGLVLANNGLGWKVKWKGEVEPTNISVSSTGGVYRAFWGTRGGVYTQVLHRGYYNPRYTSTRIPLKRTGRHETPFYNWGFQDTPKIMKLLEVKTKQCDTLNSIDVWVRFDEDAEWGNGRVGGEGTPLATLTTNPSSQHHINVGFEIIGDTEFHVGQSHEEVQFAFDFYGDPADVYATPIMKWYTLVGRKWMRPVRVWTFQIDLTKGHKNRDTRTLRGLFHTAATKKGAVPLVIGTETFVVDITTDEGNVAASTDYKGFVNVTAVESTEIGVD